MFKKSFKPYLVFFSVLLLNVTAFAVAKETLVGAGDSVTIKYDFGRSHIDEEMITLQYDFSKDRHSVPMSMKEKNVSAQGTVTEPKQPAAQKPAPDDGSVTERQKAEAKKRREKPVLKSFSMQMASFASGKTLLSDKAKEEIKLQAEEIKKFKFKQITVEGHTDSTGNRQLNNGLSKARAKAVYDEFIKSGIPEDKIEYIGFGSSIPLASNATAEGRAQNRRVDIFVE